MKKVIAFLSVLFLAQFSFVNAAEFVYVTNNADNTVSVIEVASQSVVDTINVCSQPVFAIGDPSGLFVYVTCSGNGQVDVIDTELNIVVASIAIPGGVWVIRNNRTWSDVYITNLGDRATKVRMDNLNTDGTIQQSVTSTSIAFSPDNTKAYVTDFSSNNVSVINLSNNSLIEQIDVGGGSFGIEVHPISGVIYIATGTMIRVEHPVNGLITNIPLSGMPFGVLVTSDGSTLYVGDSTGTLYKINTVNNTVIDSVSVGFIPQGIALSADESLIYVANSGSNNVSVLTNQFSLIATVPVGSNPIIPAVVDVATTRETSLIVNGQADNDMDGVANIDDFCPASEDKVVDTRGCNIAQFCASIDASTSLGRRICREADFMNDEPLMTPTEADCQVVDDLCIPNFVEDVKETFPGKTNFCHSAVLPTKLALCLMGL